MERNNNNRQERGIFPDALVGRKLISQAVLGLPNLYQKWIDRYNAKIIHRNYKQQVREIYALAGRAGRIHPKKPR